MSLRKLFSCFNASSKPKERKQAENQDCVAGTQAVAGFIPITQTAENDIFIAGYPKSGNTWFQYLIAELVYGVNAGFAPDALVQDLVPDVHSRQLYKRYSATMYFKTHDLPKPQYKRVVHLLRDGRDVMVSYFHYNVAMTRNEKLDFMEMVRDGRHLFPGKWHEHVQAWLANPYGAQILQVKFEDLKREPMNELRRLCKFAGLECDDATLEAAIAHASFESMRRREVQQGWSGKWPKDKPFIRRGKIGSYQDEMPEAVLKYFLGEAGEMLKECHYQV